MTNKIKLSLVASFVCTTLVSAESIKDLGMITISSATKSEQSIKDITSNVEVITGTELEEKHISTIADAVNLISGVSITSNGGMGSTTNLNIRGMGGNRVLVLIDGVRLQDPSNTGGANIAHLMTTDIEKVEVIKGSQSGIWGADAASGVINIITKKPKDGIHGSILAETGSFNTKKYGAEISHKNKNYDVKINAQKISSDGFTSQAPKGKDIDAYEDDAYTNTTLGLKANYNINDDAKLGLNIVNIDAKSDYDGGAWSDTADQKANNTTYASDVKTKVYALDYSQVLNKHNINVKVEQSIFERDEIGSTSGVKIFNGEHNNLELKDVFTYSNNGYIIAGIGRNNDKVDYIKVDTTTNDKKNKDNYAYLTNSNNFSNTIITQSLRYDKYNNFENKLTGKVGVKHNFTKDTYFSTNVGTSYNAPSIIQSLNPWGAANPNLNPENSKSIDTSMGYKDLKTTLFYQKVTDLIAWYDPNTSMDYSDYYYKNLSGESTFKGVEVDYKKEVINNTLLSFSYTRTSSKDKDKKDLTKRAKQNLKLGIDFYGINKLHLGLNSEYVGERFNDTAKTLQTGRYTVSNVVANYNFTKSVKFYTKIDNITNKYYQTIDGYATSPRAYYAGVKVSF